MILLFCLLFVNVYCSSNYVLNDVEIRVNSNKFNQFDHFWKSTGFCPPDPKENATDFFLSNDVKTNIALIGSLPNEGIRYVRIHWLFNLLTSNRTNGELTYNFTDMDNLLQHIHDSGLYPGFELMGSSSPKIAFEKSKSFWADLTESIVKRYIDRFGVGTVSKWRFETWNEPDLLDYNLLNFTFKEYLDYALGSYEGIESAFQDTNYTWILGGPAGVFRELDQHPICYGMLEYCSQPDKQSCPFQYLSYHKKGDGTAEGVLNVSVSFLDDIISQYPGLKSLPFSNEIAGCRLWGQKCDQSVKFSMYKVGRYDVVLSFGVASLAEMKENSQRRTSVALCSSNHIYVIDGGEADIEGNWSKSREWRADTRYAEMVLKVIAGYYKSVAVGRKLKIEVLSNDNAFLNYHPFYFTQRTLFARFQINTTTPPHQQFVKKPVYSLMGLLSFLGNEILEEEERFSASQDPLLTIIATRKNAQGKATPLVSDQPLNYSSVSVLVGYGNSSEINDESRDLNVNLTGFWNGDWKYAIYRLDNVHTNPYEVWDTLGRPVFPEQDERRQMRNVEEPQRTVDPTSVNTSYLHVTLGLTIPSVYLIHVCDKPEGIPSQVLSVNIMNVTWNEVLITWNYHSDTSECLLTYEVEFQSKCLETTLFERINPDDTVFSSFHHVGSNGGDHDCENTWGIYRIRAIDYWNRPGNYSSEVEYPKRN